MPTLEEQISLNPRLLLRLSVPELHRQLELNPSLLSHKFENGDNLLHAIVRTGSNFDAVAYLVSRGHPITSGENIYCGDLESIDISAINDLGQSVSYILEYLATHNTDNLIIREMRSLIKAAKMNTLEDFFSKDNELVRIIERAGLKHDHASDPIDEDIPQLFNLMAAEMNMTARAQDISPSTKATESKLRWKDSALEDEHAHNAPHYLSFDKKWDAKDPNHLGKRYFIAAYKENNFAQMQEAIQDYKIEFRGDDSLTKLAYQAIDEQCFAMANYLLKKSYVSPDYQPDLSSQSLQEKMDTVKREGMSLFENASQNNNMKAMENIILKYQLEFSEEQTKSLAYKAALDNNFTLMNHLLDTSEDLKMAILEHTPTGQFKSLTKILSSKVQSLIRNKDYSTAQHMFTEYKVEIPESYAKSAAYKAIDADCFNMVDHIIDKYKIPPSFQVSGEKLPLAEKLTQARLKKFNQAYENADFPVMEHFLTTYQLTPIVDASIDLFRN